MKQDDALVRQLKALKGKVNFISGPSTESKKIAVVLPPTLFKAVTK